MGKKAKVKTPKHSVRIGPFDYEVYTGPGHSYGECIHAILFNSGYTDPHDERLVDALANGLALLSRDNPGILNWPK